MQICIHCGSVVKNQPANPGDSGDVVLTMGWEYPWKKKWQPTSVFLLGDSWGQRSLVSFSPWGRRESDATE